MLSQEIINIGGRIKHYRQYKKMTQKELADKLGITHEWICKIERGKVNNISIGMLVNISDIFEIDLTCLLN